MFPGGDQVFLYTVLIQFIHLVRICDDLRCGTVVFQQEKIHPFFYAQFFIKVDDILRT